MHQLPVVVQLKMIYIHLEGFHFSAPLETRIKKYIYLKVLLGRTGGNLMGAPQGHYLSKSCLLSVSHRLRAKTTVHI